MLLYDEESWFLFTWIFWAGCCRLSAFVFAVGISLSLALCVCVCMLACVCTCACACVGTSVCAIESLLGADIGFAFIVQRITKGRK